MSSSEDPQLPEENHYSLKGSTKLVGQLYPILKARDGEILDGFHRSEADGDWRSETLENIDSDEKKIVVRLISNFHRRKLSYEEKADLINKLAKIYQEKGLKVEGVRKKGSGKNEIVEAIVSATGLNWRTVLAYLEDRFKQKNRAREDPSQHQTRSKASEIIYNALATRSSRWAQNVLERYQQELLESPIFRARVLSMLPGNHNSGAGIQGYDGQLPPDCYLGEDGFFHKKEKKSKSASENKCVIDPDAYYKVFIEECPNCICSTCPHADSCIERVRAGE